MKLEVTDIWQEIVMQKDVTLGTVIIVITLIVVMNGCYVIYAVFPVVMNII